MNCAVSNAYSYLSSLIWTPAGKVSGPDGCLVQDYGWCCSDHARVLALALKTIGVDCVVAEGSVVIHFGLPQLVRPHYFVVDSGGLVYDSSIKHVRVCGIYRSEGALEFKNICKLHEAGTNADTQFRSSQDVDAYLDYVVKDTYKPEDLALRESVTPYGDFLRSVFVHHQSFWHRVADLVSDLLNDRITLPGSLTPQGGYEGPVERAIRRRNAIDWTQFRASSSREI